MNESANRHTETKQHLGIDSTYKEDVPTLNSYQHSHPHSSVQYQHLLPVRVIAELSGDSNMKFSSALFWNTFVVVPVVRAALTPGPDFIRLNKNDSVRFPLPILSFQGAN